MRTGKSRVRQQETVKERKKKNKKTLRGLGEKIPPRAGEGGGETEVRLHRPTPGPRGTKPQWPRTVTAPLLAPASPLPAPLCPSGPLAPVSGSSPFCRS